MELLLIPGIAFLVGILLKNTSTTNLLNAIYQKYKGTPYKWGGTLPTGFDCSGFSQYVYKKYFNKLIPRTAAQQAAAAKKTNTPSPGDLLFFAAPGSNQISHVGLYLDPGKFLHSGSSNGVEIATLNNYWAPRLRFYGKI